MRPLLTVLRPSWTRLLSSCVLAVALVLPAALCAPAYAESGAHRNPPPPPAHVDVVIAESR